MANREATLEYLRNPDNIINKLEGRSYMKMKNIQEYLVRLCKEKQNIIGRKDIIKEFSGDYLLDILEKSHIEGDKMKNLDELVKEMLLIIKGGLIVDSDLIEDGCEKYDKCNHNGRKSCKRSEYTLDCRKLELKINYSKIQY